MGTALWGLGIVVLFLTASSWGLRTAGETWKSKRISLWVTIAWFSILLLLVAAAGVGAILYSFHVFER